MNKKGQFGFILLFFILVAVLLGGALLISIGVGVVRTSTDAIIPELEGIGMVGDTNVSQSAKYVTTPVNGFLNSLDWMGGVVYLVAIIGLFGLAFTYKYTMNKLFIAVFLGFAVLLIFLSIVISNMYEEFYTSNDELGTQLQSQSLLSWLILQAPLVFTVMIFAAGIVLFSGMNEEDTV
jgi:hypothetical protein